MKVEQKSSLPSKDLAIARSWFFFFSINDIMREMERELKRLSTHYL